MYQFVDDQGITRHLGNIIPTQGLQNNWPVYGASPQQPLILRTHWRELIGNNTDPSHPFGLLDYVHDQNGYGMCNMSATAAAMEQAAVAAGLPHEPLSAGDGYRRVSGGVDRGSLLEHGIIAAHTGLLTVKQCPYLDWRNNRGTDADRAANAVQEAYLCPTFAHCMSAALSGFFLVSGIMWYENYTPGRDGWLPLSRSGRPGGHAVNGFKPTYREVNGSTQFGIWHKNSWSRRWGMDGLCVFPESVYDGVFPKSVYDGAIGGWWAVRVVTGKDGDIPAPKN